MVCYLFVNLDVVSFVDVVLWLVGYLRINNFIIVWVIVEYRKVLWLYLYGIEYFKLKSIMIGFLRLLYLLMVLIIILLFWLFFVL